MNVLKRKKLEEAGFRVTTVTDFLGLSAEESELIEIKLALTAALKKQRKNSSLSQYQLAEYIGSSQSRVAKMEAGDPHVSLDLMIRALLALGMTRNDLANAISPQLPLLSAMPICQVSLTPFEARNGHYKFQTCAPRLPLEAFASVLGV